MVPRPFRLDSPTSIGALFAALPFSANAESASAATGAGDLLQVMLSLAVVILLLIGTLYFLKRLAAPRGGSSKLLKVIAGAAIGTRERVVVVEIGETWLVLGVAPGQVTSLHQLPRQMPTGELDEAATDNRNFADWLKHMMEKHHAAR